MYGMYRMTFLQRQETGQKRPRRTRSGMPPGTTVLRSGGLAILLMTLAVWAGSGAVSPAVSPKYVSPGIADGTGEPPTPQSRPASTPRTPESETWWPQKGSCLVALISTECSHCQHAVPNLNAYVTTRGLPPLHALCYNEPWQVTLFQKQWGARFPVHRTTFDVFMQRLAGHSSPCLQWVVNGTVKLTVEPPLPPPEELRRRIQQGRIQQAGQPVPSTPKPSGNNRKRP